MTVYCMMKGVTSLSFGCPNRIDGEQRLFRLGKAYAKGIPYLLTSRSYVVRCLEEGLTPTKGKLANDVDVEDKVFVEEAEDETCMIEMRETTTKILFVISKPDVFKSPASDTYIVFGEAKIEDLSSQLQTQAAEQFKAPDLSSVISKSELSAIAEDDEDVDETGVEPKDIELVMTQAGVSRSKAVKALKASEGDIVSAILELTN
ncbi:nascent polypeptide-associated complex subunit alpha-like protein 1 [Cinnamomum micranthum f. kanehirae]|uniref:Nascent polypeptide-associated complex subunit alpha-like protein 1 n=1 Tax=Cinnamomum micranthum f. kanehirae TaxID=337451 RepID=A0A3S3N322_9MAGN|nr:nascent polypeptide-associated complex subunit alpha-like protein 1 [Cinnamomum micranthum f. kanehirae]